MSTHALRFVLVPALAALLASTSSTPASAGDAPEARIADLEHELLVAKVRLDLWAERTKGLYRLAGRLMEELRAAEIRRQGEIDELRAELAAERKRHGDDVGRLEEDLRAAKHLRDRARQTALAHQRRLADLEDTAEKRRRDLERLQWHLHLAAPAGSVRKALGYESISHWQRELKEGDPARQRVALRVLAYLPDRSKETIAAILSAASSDNGLLDAGTGALVAAGEAAVLPLVETGRRKGGPPVAWVMHVLGEIGPDARAALPWLREIRADPDHGRDRDAAERAIRRIEGP